MSRHIAVLTLLASALAGHLCNAEFLTDRELEDQKCTSTAYQTVARVTVTNPPTVPVDVLRFPGVVKKLKLECFQIFESLTYPSLLASNPSLLRSCGTSNAAVSICIAPHDPAIRDVDADWTCSSLAQYSRQPLTSTTWTGSTPEQQIRVKFQWSPQLTTQQCYPRDLTVQIVAYEPDPPGTSLAASVVFILIVVAVGLGVIAFAIYSLRKSLNEQFKRAELERAIPPGEDADAELERGVNKALGYEMSEHDDDGAQAPNTRDDLYVDREDTFVTMTDRNEVLESRPMPKPWYERMSYRANDAAREPESISKTYDDRSRADVRTPVSGERAGSAVRRRNHTTRVDGGGAGSARKSLSTFYDDPQHEGPQARGAASWRNDGNSLRDDPEPEDETVLVCGDCELPIHDVNTPQYCALTGMRHR